MMQLPDIPLHRGIFVTGTDTNVGKTTVAGAVTAVLRQRGRRVGYFKPIQSGCPEEGGRLIPSDARWVKEIAALPESLDLLTPVTLRLPLAPAVAAAEAGAEIDLEAVARAYRELAGRYDFLVVEGAGGLYVPLRGMEFLVLDLARWLGLPLVVVARAGLGTINHTCLTVRAALGAGLAVWGTIINQYPEEPSLAERTNPPIIAQLSGRPILGKIPLIPALETPAGQAALVAAVAREVMLPEDAGDRDR